MKTSQLLLFSIVPAFLVAFGIYAKKVEGDVSAAQMGLESDLSAVISQIPRTGVQNPTPEESQTAGRLSDLASRLRHLHAETLRFLGSFVNTAIAAGLAELMLIVVVFGYMKRARGSN